MAGATFGEEHEAAREELNEIQELVKAGVLGSEMCPEREFCRWPVLDPTRLPAWLDQSYNMYEEVRWYKY